MDKEGKLLVPGTEILLWDNDSWGIHALSHVQPNGFSILVAIH